MPVVALRLGGSALDSNPSVSGHLDLIGEFRRRFPPFDSIVGRFGENTPTERIPWFFGFILSAATRPGPGACCFVLDKTLGTTTIAGILAALVRLQNDFPNLVERYARTALSRGQRVKVKPSDFVYEYEGIWEDFPNFFRLKLIGEGAWRSFPLVDVLRLEPTDRVRPKGTGGSDLGVFERSPLDHLLDLTTCGNNSVIRNAVLVHMARTQFARIANSLILTPRPAGQFARLSRFLPWGSIGHDGTLKPNDPHQVIGEPLIAATSVSEDLALASSLADVASKIVLVDGARKLARDIQAFDDIADRQRTVVLASPDESEDLDLLKNRGCPIWHMSAGEVLIGEASADQRARKSLVGATIRAADISRRANVRMVVCRDDVLEVAAESLDRAVKVIGDSEEVSEAEEILARLFRVLFDCSECCFGVCKDTEDDLRSTRDRMDRHARWLESAVAEAFRDAFDRLEHAISSGFGTQKVEGLLEVITEHDTKWAIATRSHRTAEKLREEMEILGAELPVLPVSAISSNHEYDGIILSAWPNDQRFTRLRNLSVTPEIRVLTYPFESKWVLRHQARKRAREGSYWLDTDMRSSILGIEPRFLPDLDSPGKKNEPTPAKEISFDLPTFKFEDRIARHRITHPPVAVDGKDSREAQLVQFFGGCYALLTEWAELPILNDLINSGNGVDAKLTSATASRLSIGDFVLFRAGGEKEFVRLIAEESFGAQEYRRIRDVAERWKFTLRRLGDRPASVQRRLAGLYVERSLPTIAGWLGNPDRIGPGNYDDIEAIAKAAGDKELLSTKDAVRVAISRIRGAHQAAGKRLTTLILGELQGRLNDLGDQPTLLDLAYGEAWVVQVETVETKRREYPASQVNRLLWTADSAF